MARCAARTCACKVLVAFSIGWTILTVYHPHQVHINSRNCRFLQLSILDLWREVVAYLIHPGVCDLKIMGHMCATYKDPTHRDVNGAESVKCGLE